MATIDAGVNDLQARRARLVDDALRSLESTWDLRGTLRALLALNHDRAVLERELTRRMLDLRAAGRGREEDAIYDVLQDLVGWCSPGLEL